MMPVIVQMREVGRDSVDLVRVRVLGTILRWRHLRTVLQSSLLAVAILVIYDGFTGSPVAPKNPAGVLPWVQWRGLTVLSLLLAGSLFCTACPFVLVRRLSKRLFGARRPWPARLRGKWLAAALLVAFFWFYEALDPWATPWLTASLALAYFLAAFVIDGLFQGAAFCKYLCPIGQFNFLNSTCSPLEVRVRDLDVCPACSTKDCIVGRVTGQASEERDARSEEHLPLPLGEGRGEGLPQSPTPNTQHPTQSSVLRTQSSVLRVQQGCELFLFQPQKVGNVDCTFCLDCLHACLHDNVAVAVRMPVRELWDGRRRSNLGVLHERLDVAFLALVLVFASFMNAFGMVGPFYGFETSLMTLLGIHSRLLVLAVVFFAGLVVLPVCLVSLAAAGTRVAVRSRESVSALATRFAYSLVPLGFGMWAAHYGFHFLTGGLTVVPVLQNFLVDVGVPVLGTPRWDLAPLVPSSWLLPIELTLLEAGLLGSLVVAYRIADRSFRDRRLAVLGFLPWATLALLLFATGVWLMLQPMEMRGMLRTG